MYHKKTDYGKIIEHASDCLSAMCVTIYFDNTADSYFRFAIVDTYGYVGNQVMVVSGIRGNNIIVSLREKKNGKLVFMTGVRDFYMPIKDMSNDFLFQLWNNYLKNIIDTLTADAWERFSEKFCEKFDSYYIDITKQNYLKD